MIHSELTKALKARNLSDAEAARLIGVNRTTVWRWRNRQLQITPKAEAAIRWALHEHDNGRQHD